MSSSTSSSSQAFPLTEATDRTHAAQALAHFAAGLVLTLLVVFGGTELLLRQKVVPQDTFQAQAALFHIAETGDAAFGDSHGARDFVPPAGMVNLAFPSESVDHMNWKARRYFQDRRPGRVIVQADPHLFAPYRLVNRLADYADEIARWGAARRGAYLMDNRYRPQLIAFWRAFFRSGGDLSSRVHRTDNGALLSPGDLSEKPPRVRRFEAYSRIGTHSQVAGPATRERMATYAAMLGFLAARGAELCLVTYPVAPDYLQAFAEVAEPAAREERARTLAFFASEAARHGAVYVNHEAAVTGLEQFRDVDHLNGAGAGAYSRRLTEDCFGTAGN